MADDTTLFLKDIISIGNSLVKFKEFETISGLKLNIKKTELIPLGSARNLEITLPAEIAEIKINWNPFKALAYGLLFQKKK